MRNDCYSITIIQGALHSFGFRQARVAKIRECMRALHVETPRYTKNAEWGFGINIPNFKIYVWVTTANEVATRGIVIMCGGEDGNFVRRIAASSNDDGARIITAAAMAIKEIKNRPMCACGTHKYMFKPLNIIDS